MVVREFIYRLHHDIEKVKPPDWEPDWADAPLPFKLYRHLPSIRLPADIPLSLTEARGRGYVPDVREFGHFLWYAYGISLGSHAAPSDDASLGTYGDTAAYRRVVPSGGGLYPCELYVYLKLPKVPNGIYHYDAAHHRLALLRAGSFDDYLNAALGGRLSMQDCFGAVIVSTVYWKNFFKYHYFSYRLQGLDAGVLIGQLQQSAERFGYSSIVCYQYLDRAIHHLIGLFDKEESVYAVIPLSAGAAMDERERNAGGPHASASELIRELPAVRHEKYERSRRIRPFPLLLRMNEASMLEKTSEFRVFDAAAVRTESRHAGSLTFLPRVARTAFDFAALSRSRYSPETDFVLKRTGKEQLAELLLRSAAVPTSRSDLDGGCPKPSSPRIALYVCCHGVEGMADGAYRYDTASHALQMVRPGDHRSWLQCGLTFHNVSLSQVPLIFHAAGDRHHNEAIWGTRGYRIQQMEAGALVQRLLMSASAAGLGGRPLLGYETKAVDDLYRLPIGNETALIQIPIGPYRYRSRWECGLHG